MSLSLSLYTRVYVNTKAPTTRRKCLFKLFFATLMICCTMFFVGWDGHICAHNARCLFPATGVACLAPPGALGARHRAPRVSTNRQPIAWPVRWGCPAGRRLPGEINRNHVATGRIQGECLHLSWLMNHHHPLSLTSGREDLLGKVGGS